MKNFEVSKDLQKKQVIHLDKTDKVFFDDLQLTNVSSICLKNDENLQIAEFYNEGHFKIASIEIGGKIRITVDEEEGQARQVLIETTY